MQSYGATLHTLHTLHTTLSKGLTTQQKFRKAMETIPKWRRIRFLMKTHTTNDIKQQRVGGKILFLMTLETSATGRLATNFQGKLVDDIRKRKGLPTDEKVVKDATKQRTVTRVLVLLYEWCTGASYDMAMGWLGGLLHLLHPVFVELKLMDLIVCRAVLQHC